MPVVRAAEIESFEIDGIQVWGLATAARGAAEMMLWRNRIASGRSLPPARQDHEQVVVVLGGSGTLREDGREESFSCGDVLIVAPGTLWQIVPAAAGEPFECLMAMPLATRHFSSAGSAMRLPWTD